VQLKAVQHPKSTNQPGDSMYTHHKWRWIVSKAVPWAKKIFVAIIFGWLAFIGSVSA
jgi:hypothetical protein